MTTKLRIPNATNPFREAPLWGSLWEKARRRADWRSRAEAVTGGMAGQFLKAAAVSASRLSVADLRL